MLGGAIVAGVGAGCGKKGPPLAPLVRLPVPVDPFAARRLGSTVYVQFTIPSKNQDNSTPADVSRVDVYGYTGSPASDDDIVKYGTLVATVPVRRPPPPEEENDREPAKEQTGKQKPAKAKTEKPKPKPVEPEPGFDQGATVTVTEALTQALMQPVEARRRSRGRAATKAQEPVLPPPASAVPLPERVYVGVGVSRKGHRGSFSRHASVPLLDPPAPPSDLELSHTETAITLEWTPPPGAPASPGEAAKTPALDVKPIVPPGGPTWSYQVYEIPPAASTPAPPSAAAAAPRAVPLVTLPVPLNPRPLTSTTFTDPTFEFGTERCYAVRTMKAFGAMQEESEPSEVRCITPRDIYPPAAPKGLTAVVSAGSISLIWDPNGEKDLDGYLVLRAEAPGGTLQPLTRERIHDTTYNDAGVKPGVRYIYAVVAVDKAGNVSAQSDRVEETAR